MPNNMNGAPNPEAGSQEPVATGWEEVEVMAEAPAAGESEMPKNEPEMSAGELENPPMPESEYPPMTPPEDLQMEKLAVDEMAVTDNEPKAGMDKLPVVDENGNEYEVDLTEAGGETQEKIGDEELQAYMESLMGPREKNQ